MYLEEVKNIYLNRPKDKKSKAILTEKALKLLSLNASLGARDQIGNTPFWTAIYHAASISGFTEYRAEIFSIVKIMIDILVKKKISLNITDRFSCTALHYAASSGDLEMIQALCLAGAELGLNASPDARNKHRETPLHFAAQHLAPKNSVEFMINLLVEKKGSLDLIGRNGRTPLHYAAESGHVEMIRALFLAQAKLDLPDEKRMTPLHLAANSNQDAAAACLIGCGANPNAQHIGGQTPLMLAAKWGHVETVRVLVENGADAGIIDSVGKTALHYAAERAFIDKEKMEMFKLLVEAKPSTIDAVDKKGKKPIHYIPEEMLNNGYQELGSLLGWKVSTEA